MAISATVTGYIATNMQSKETAKGILHKLAIGVYGPKGETQYVNVMWMGGLFDGVIPFLHKGTSVAMMGQLNKPRAYVGKDGVPVAALEMWLKSIELLPTKKEGPRGPSYQTEDQMMSKQAEHQEEELPF